MKPKQRLFIKIIVIGNILFFLSQIIWQFTRHKIYWIGYEVHKPQTPWQRFIDSLHNWWYGLSRESVLLFGFLIAGIIFFFLSCIMED